MENRWKGKLGKSTKTLLPDSRTAAVLLVIIFGLGAALRIYKLDSSLWLDEILTVVRLDERPLLYIMTHYHGSNNHILHSILAHISISLFGESEITIRLPAFLLGILSIPLIYKVARELFDERVGLVSAFLLSISVFHILHSQNARGYTGLVFFSLLSLLFLLKAIKIGKKRYWVGFIISTVLNIYIIPLGIIVLGIQILFFLVISIHISPLRADVRLLKKFLLSAGAGLLIIFLLYLPVLSEMLSLRARQAATYQPRFNLLTFKKIFFSFSLGPQHPGLWRWRNLYVFFFLFLTGVFAGFKEYERAILLCLLWTLSVFIAAYFLPDWPRIYIFVLPLYLIVISKGVTSIGILLTRLTKSSRLHKSAESIVIYILALGLFGGMSINPLRRYYSLLPKENWKGVAQYLKERIKPSDSVYVRPEWSTYCLKYYLRNTGLRVEKIPEPLPQEDLTLYFIYRLYYTKMKQLVTEISALQEHGLVRHKTFKGRCPIKMYALKVSTANLKRKLIGNSGFEEDDQKPTQWAKADWGGSTAVSIDTKICSEGKNSVKLIPQTNKVNFVLFSEYFRVEPGKVFVFSGDTRREENRGNAAIAIWFYDLNKNFLSRVRSDALDAKKDWGRLAKAGLVPATAVYARIGLRVWGQVGTENIIHFDDIKIYMSNDRDNNAN